MKKTYIGPAGTFLKDGPYDRPQATKSSLPKGSYKKTCAPWDRLKTKVAKKKEPAVPKTSTEQKPPKVPQKPTGKQITTPNDKQLRPGKPGDYQTK